MKYNVEILPSAWEDLKKIEDWYLLEFGTETAIKVSDHILTTLSRLEEFPDSGSLTPDDWMNEKGYRMIISGKHIAIYRHMGQSVYVYHIANAREDYGKLFFINKI